MEWSAIRVSTDEKNARKAHCSYSLRIRCLRGVFDGWIVDLPQSPRCWLLLVPLGADTEQDRRKGPDEGHPVLPSQTHTPDQIPQMETNWTPHKQEDVEKVACLYLLRLCSLLDGVLSHLSSCAPTCTTKLRKKLIRFDSHHSSVFKRIGCGD